MFIVVVRFVNYILAAGTCYLQTINVALSVVYILNSDSAIVSYVAISAKAIKCLRNLKRLHQVAIVEMLLLSL